MIGARSNATAEYIFSADPALDIDSPSYDLKQYLKTFDRKHLPVREGKTATVFKIRRLPRVTWTALASLESQASRAVQTVCYGLVGVENFLNGNGTHLNLEFVGEGVEKRLTAATMDALWSSELFAELASVIVRFGELDPLADAR